MTPYALLLQLCGLSHREAADFHGVRPDTVKSWSAGRNRAPGTVLDELRALNLEIESAAARHLEALREHAPIGIEIEIGYPADDHEAQSLGLPCVGAWRAMAARVVAGLAASEFHLVPRGSTLATAGAIEARERGKP